MPDEAARVLAVPFVGNGFVHPTALFPLEDLRRLERHAVVLPFLLHRHRAPIRRHCVRLRFNDLTLHFANPLEVRASRRFIDTVLNDEATSAG